MLIEFLDSITINATVILLVDFIIKESWNIELLMLIKHWKFNLVLPIFITGWLNVNILVKFTIWNSTLFIFNKFMIGYLESNNFIQSKLDDNPGR